MDGCESGGRRGEPNQAPVARRAVAEEPAALDADAGRGRGAPRRGQFDKRPVPGNKAEGVVDEGAPLDVDPRGHDAEKRPVGGRLGEHEMGDANARSHRRHRRVDEAGRVGGIGRPDGNGERLALGCVEHERRAPVLTRRHDHVECSRGAVLDPAAVGGGDESRQLVAGVHRNDGAHWRGPVTGCGVPAPSRLRFPRRGRGTSAESGRTSPRGRSLWRPSGSACWPGAGCTA